MESFCSNSHILQESYKAEVVGWVSSPVVSCQ